MTDARVVEFGRGFEKLLGLQVVEATADRVVAVVPVTGDLLQGHGIVHGGVYAAAVETCASLGAYLWLDGRGVPVGLSNHTEFVHAVHEGAELRAEALPLRDASVDVVLSSFGHVYAPRPERAASEMLRDLKHA